MSFIKGNNFRIGIIAGVLSAITWGTYGTFVNYLTGFGMTEEVITLIIPFALTIYFAILLLVKNKKAFKVNWKYLIAMAIVGFAFVDGQNFFMAKAYSSLPFAMTATIIFCNCFITMILSRIFFKNKITPIKIGAGITAVIGVALILNIFSEGGLSGYAWTDLKWIPLAIITVSATYTAYKFFCENGVAYEAVMFYVSLFATILWAAAIASPSRLFAEMGSVISGGGTLYLIGFFLIPAIMSFHLYIYSISKVDPSWTAITYSFDPVSATILGFIFFAQKPSIMTIIGMIIVIIAVAFVNYIEGKENIAVSETSES